MPWKLGQCFGSLNTLTCKGCSETGAFGHSLNHIVRIQQLRKYWSYETNLFFSKCLKLYVDSKIAIVNWENDFGFEDNWVGTCCVNFSLVWQENMWLAVMSWKAVLTSKTRLTDMINNRLSLILMESWPKSAAVRTWALFKTS